MEHSDFPVKNPIITDVLAEAVQREMLEQAKKPKAFPTWFRHSDAGKCGRYLWYEHLGTEQSNPVDASSAWVMYLGTFIHEELQRALKLRFPDCTVERSVRHGDVSSGHLDADLVLPDGTKVCYELKSRGSFAFDKASGWNRRGWKTAMPEGPAATTKIQGALNATAIDADLLVIGYIAMESLSKGFAEKCGVTEFGRTVSEWHYNKAEFGPWAEDELARLRLIRSQMEANIVPKAEAIGDEMEVIKLNPNAAKPAWQCTYCSHLDTCQKEMH
jgi:hypothetical protein